MSEKIVFGTRYVEHKGEPAFLVGSVAASHEQIDFFRDSREENTCLDVPVTAYEADMVMAGLRMLKARYTRAESTNCATLVHDIVGMKLNGDIETSLPIGWEFEAAEISKRHLSYRMCTYRALLPEASPVGLGYWYALLDPSTQLALHIDGMNGPLLLQSTTSLSRMYPEDQFTHYDAAPRQQLDFLLADASIQQELN